MKKETPYTILAILLILNSLDLLTTLILLDQGLAEMNPFHNHFNTIGVQWMDVIMKLVVLPVGTLIPSYFLIKEGYVRLMTGVFLVLTLFYFWVVLNNMVYLF